MEMDCLVGFRFKPTYEEIVLLLKKKRLEPDFSVQTVKQIDFYNFDPWDLPRHSDIESKELIWYFYCKPYYKYAKSKRSHRRTNSGYWKITGKGSDMKTKNKKDVIGRKRILSFYFHDDTIFKEWVLHEIYIEDDPHYKEDFVICRLERKREKPSISTSDDSESSNLVVTEETSPKSVLPSTQPVFNHVAKPVFNHVAEKTLVQPNRWFEGYKALDNGSFSELQSPIYPEQGSSYYSSSSNGCDFLNFDFDTEQLGDLIISPKYFENECSCDVDAETIASWACVSTMVENWY